MIAFVQPFGLHSPGGGPRILRALAQQAPLEVLSVCTSLEPPPATSAATEIHVPVRPHFGRIERTRFKKLLDPFYPSYFKGFQQRLAQSFRDRGVTQVHAVAHDFDFWPVYECARDAKLPFHLSIHDDLLYALRGSPRLQQAEDWLAQAWTGASTRYVISEAMGREYAQRYGSAPYLVVTDGNENIPQRPETRPDKSVRVYFMGLFHRSYAPNWQALAQGMDLLAAEHTDWSVSLTARCGSLPADATTKGMTAKVVPFGSEADVALDMKDADALYLPLPFGQDYANFVRFSLSTKMVTYLGSGLPILYHGPADAAACELLSEHGAALCITSQQPEDVARGLAELPARREAIVASALALAAREFDLEVIRQRFWQGLNS